MGKNRNPKIARQKRIQKNIERNEAKANQYGKKELLVKFILSIISGSLGLGLFYFILVKVSSGNSVVENIGMVIEGFIFLFLCIYLVSLLRLLMNRIWKSFLLSVVAVVFVYYLSQFTSVFLLMSLDAEYIAMRISYDYTFYESMRNFLFNLHSGIIGIFTLQNLSSIFDVIYTSSYIAGFLSPLLLVFNSFF